MRDQRLRRRSVLGFAAGLMAIAIGGEVALAADKINVGALRFTSHSASFVALSAAILKTII